MVSRDTLGGARSEGNDINNSGHVTGWALNAEGKQEAFLYDGTNMVGLCSLVDCEAQGWRELNAGTAINNQGSIAGYGYVLDDYSVHAFLLRVLPDSERDDDEDGLTENQGDCDDENADINPGVEEVCDDGVDNGKRVVMLSH